MRTVTERDSQFVATAVGIQNPPTPLSKCLLILSERSQNYQIAKGFAETKTWDGYDWYWGLSVPCRSCSDAKSGCGIRVAKTDVGLQGVL